jgi:hypothetical protein
VGYGYGEPEGGGGGISQADADARYVNETDHTKAAHDALGIAPGDGTVGRAKMSQNNRGLIICTSTTRPTGTDAPEGQHIYETDTDATLKNTGTPTAPVWSVLGGGGTSGPPLGHIEDLSYRWDSATQYTVLAGKVLVNGALLTVAQTARTPTLTANTLLYVYVFNNAGTAVIEESTTAPVWDPALQYFKLGGAAPDANRRCIGFFVTDGTPAIRRFRVLVFSRLRQFQYIDGTIKRYVNGVASDAAWTSFSLAPFVPAHAIRWWAVPKLGMPAAGNEAALGVSSIDLGTADARTAPFSVRMGASGNVVLFLGNFWLDTGDANTAWFRTWQGVGSNTAFIDVSGAEFYV